MMRYLIFTNTPAHIHLYKHLVDRLAETNEVLVLARDYGCTVKLADAYDLPYRVYGKCDTTKYSLLRNLPRHYLNIIAETRRYDPDLIFGMGAYAAHAGAASRTPTILLLDSESTHVDHAISRPFARAILTPEAFTRDLGSKHYVFPGFKESAYLHPDVFDVDDSVRERLGIGDDPYVILRFNAFGSHHDVAEGGFTRRQRRALIHKLDDHATVVVSDEGDDLDLGPLPAREFDLHPAMLHDALAKASLVVSDTQTVVTESALLGTPTIRSNSFVGDKDMGNFLELEAHGLVENLREFDTVRSRAVELLENDDSQRRWRRNRDSFVAEMVNLTEVLEQVARNPRNVSAVPSLSRKRTPLTLAT